MQTPFRATREQYSGKIIKRDQCFGILFPKKYKTCHAHFPYCSSFFEEGKTVTWRRHLCLSYGKNVQAALENGKHIDQLELRQWKLPPYLGYDNMVWSMNIMWIGLEVKTIFGFIFLLHDQENVITYYHMFNAATLWDISGK